MTSAPLIVPIVEGHGEVEAVPLLLRRISTALRPELVPVINPPTRIKASSFLSDEAYFQKYIKLASAKAARGNGLVLILLDCEDDFPCVVGPQLLRKAQSVRGDVSYLTALAFREYETWFLTAAKSLRGCSGLPEDLESPSNPESIRGAKEWLGRHMPNSYDPVIHQAAFTRQFDLEQASRNSSFGRLKQRIEAHLKHFHTRIP